MVDWDYLKTLLEDKLGIPGNVLDYIAVKDILQLCASGSSNQNISRFTNVDLDYVTSTIREFLLFDGWIDDCDLNPYMTYQSCQGVYSDFEREILLLYPFYTKNAIMQMYSAANLYKLIEDKMEEYWK